MTKRVDVSCLYTDAVGFYQNGLYVAATHKNEDIAVRLVEMLINCGIKISTSIDQLKQTPLYYAVREGHAKLVKIFIENGCNVNHLDVYGQNPIYYSVSVGNVPITRLLVGQGSDPDVVDLNG